MTWRPLPFTSNCNKLPKPVYNSLDTGNSCHGNRKMHHACFFLCFLSDLPPSGKGVTICHWSHWDSFWLEVKRPLPCVLWLHEKDGRRLQQAIYMGGSRHAAAGTCARTLHSASLPLHKWKCSCGAVRLGGCSRAGALQQAGFSLLHKNKWQKLRLTLVVLSFGCVETTFYCFKWVLCSMISLENDTIWWGMTSGVQHEYCFSLPGQTFNV